MNFLLNSYIDSSGTINLESFELVYSILNDLLLSIECFLYYYYYLLLADYSVERNDDLFIVYIN